MQAELRAARLYAIVDLNYVLREDVSSTATKLLDGGVDVMQLRAKQLYVNDVCDLARDLHAQTSARGVPLIVNDYPAVARDAGAEGVHVGQDDVSVQQARNEAGANYLVGKSTHSISQAVAAEAEGADYIGFGPLFATPTKPDYAPIGLSDIAEVHRRVSIPIFCIGGINIDNLQRVIDAGAQRVVIVSALLRAHDIVAYARCATDMLA